MFDELRATPEVLYGAIIAFVIVVLLTPAVGGMARMLGVVDRPDARRINRRPIPRLGGLAIFLGILVPSLAFLDLSGEMPGCPARCGDRDASSGPSTTSAGSSVGRSSSASSSLQRSRPPSASGSTTFTFPFLGVVDVPAWIGVPRHDPLDRRGHEHGQLPRRHGRARGGRLGIAGVTSRSSRSRSESPTPAILSAIVAGACLGFLRHNFFPARIFMGDSGALCLGFTLAAVSIQGLLKTASTVVLLPLLVLAVPIIDTSFVVARRLKHRLPIYDGRPLAPPPPLPQHRVLAATGGG